MSGAAHEAFRYVGSATFGTASVAAVIDAAFGLGTALVYADGTTRTPGTGSAWTWLLHQNAGVSEAMRGTPPTDTITSRVILAGAASLPTPAPTPAAPDAVAINILMANVVKNAGAWVSWNAAAPYTSGQVFGYWRVWPTTAGVGTVRLYEGIDVCKVVIETASGTSYEVILNGLLDGITTGVPDSEADGKLYGIITSGSAAAVSSGFNGASGAYMDHLTSASNAHAGVFTPGGSTILTMSRRTIAGVAMTPTGMKSRSGQFVRGPIEYRASAAAPNDNTLGRLREILMFSDGKTATKQTNAGTTIGYLVGANSVADQDAVFLEHA